MSLKNKNTDTPSSLKGFCPAVTELYSVDEQKTKRGVKSVHDLEAATHTNPNPPKTLE